MLNYNIAIFPASEAQREKNILGRVKVEIQIEEKTVVELNDAVIRMGKDGEPWVAYPSYRDRQERKSDRTGKDLYWHYYRLYPQDREAQVELSNQILEKYRNMQGSNPAQQPTATATPKAPVTQVAQSGAENDLNFSDSFA